MGQRYKTEKRQIEETCDAMRRVDAALVGTVLQQSEKAKDEAGYGSDYGYGSRYGYGYGYGAESTGVKKPWYQKLLKKA